MPQFDSTTFLTQIFWLIITFSAFYFLSTQFILNHLSTIFKTRKAKLELNTIWEEEQSKTMQTEEFLLSHSFIESREILQLLLNTNWIDHEFSQWNEQTQLDLTYLNHFGSICAKEWLVLESISEIKN